METEQALIGLSSWFGAFGRPYGQPRTMVSPIAKAHAL
jgi:hypothetical protein